MGWTKRHSYFYPEGPDTVETILPIPADEVPEQLRAWPGLEPRSDLDAARLMKSWLERSEPLQVEVSRTLKSWIDACVPYSVVQFTEWTWIAFKRPEMVEQTTCYGNCILVPLNEPLSELPNGFPLQNNPEIEEFVHVFRNICGSIPPTNTLWRADSAPELLRGSQFNLSLKEWENSLPLFHDGTGDVIVARRDGMLGCFEKGGAYSPIPRQMTTGQFIDTLARMVDGATFESSND